MQRYTSRTGESGTVLLFVRELKSDFDGPQLFVFLGKAKHSYHTGSNPMNIVWELKEAIPAKYLNKTNKL